MNILLLDGSPRKGNTQAAVAAIAEGIEANIALAHIDLIKVSEKKIASCTGCNGCKVGDETCVIIDDMVEIIEKVKEAEMIVFASPVYWWGITAQLKQLIDRLYALPPHARNYKKIGLLTIGEASLDGPQYRIIGEQFSCICKHLGWEMVFEKSISARDLDEVKNNPKILDELLNLWEKIE